MEKAEHAETDWQRLHPFTLVYRALRSIPQLLFAFIPILWSTSGRATAIASLVLTIGFGVFVVPFLAAQYARFRYRVTQREIIIRSGVFSQQVRNIPIDKIQRVEILQPMLARLFKTSRVLLMTAGGAGAEGVLEYVSIEEAHHLRAAIRTSQEQKQDAVEAAPALPDASAALAPAATLFTLTPGLLLRQGMMRFSLVYIALAFSFLQMVDIQLVDIVDFFIEQRYTPYADYLPDSPALTALLTFGLAFALSWVAGIITTANAYHGFTLTREGRDKLYTRRGLLSRYERTIPLRKVQAVVFRSNAVMRHYGYTRLSAQTMGLDENARGAAPVVPFAPETETLQLTEHVFGYHAPDALNPVSPLFFRRASVRYLAGLLLLVVAPAWWLPEALWGLLAAPVVVALAWAQYKTHRYHFDGATVVVQHGAFWRKRWAIPLSRAQAFDLSATYFQRRLGLVTLHLDTAGASELGGPLVRDLDSATGEALLHALRAAFPLQPRGSLYPFSVAHQPEVEHDGDDLAHRGLLHIEDRPADGERPRSGADYPEPPGEAHRKRPE